MAVQLVTMYRASDGAVFETAAEAAVHDRLAEFRRWCRESICVGGEWSANMVADEILAHWAVLPKDGGAAWCLALEDTVRTTLRAVLTEFAEGDPNFHKALDALIGRDAELSRRIVAALLNDFGLKG